MATLHFWGEGVFYNNDNVVFCKERFTIRHHFMKYDICVSDTNDEAVEEVPTTKIPQFIVDLLQPEGAVLYRWRMPSRSNIETLFASDNVEWHGGLRRITVIKTESEANLLWSPFEAKMNDLTIVANGKSIVDMDKQLLDGRITCVASNGSHIYDPMLDVTASSVLTATDPETYIRYMGRATVVICTPPAQIVPWL